MWKKTGELDFDSDEDGLERGGLKKMFGPKNAFFYLVFL